MTLLAALWGLAGAVLHTAGLILALSVLGALICGTCERLAQLKHPTRESFWPPW